LIASAVGSPDEQVVVLAQKRDDRRVELVAADADRRVRDDTRKRDHRDLGGSAADVDDHVAGRCLDREAHTDGRSHGLVDHVDTLRAGGHRGGAHGAALELGDARGNADDHPRLDAENAFGGDLLEEMTEHHFRHVHVGDHAVFERTDRLDPLGRAAEHALGLEPDAHDATAALLDGHHGGLVEDDPLALHVHERVCRPEIDGDVVHGDESPRVEPATQLRQQTLCGFGLSRGGSA
jgi:hypothetical protein